MKGKITDKEVRDFMNKDLKRLNKSYEEKLLKEAEFLNALAKWMMEPYPIKIIKNEN